ncbi:ATP-binding protein [Phenylobacterium sp.]|uniref:ATP-binding protein n=1 Tax=Phenylobacterium sp. TaxID=1871053 RepID=UPI00301B9F59
MARIAVVMFLALSIECLGGEWLFQRAEAERVAEARLRRLAEHLAVADRIVADLPHATRDSNLRRLWPGDPNLRWTADADGGVARLDAAPMEEVRAALDRATPALSSRGVRLSATSAPGRLAGAMQLQDGSWLRFETRDVALASPVLERLGGPLLTLLAGVSIATAGLAVMVARPLRRLAWAADQVGRAEDPVVVPEEGPKEVRLVAGAFNAMRDRLLQQVDERMQALAAVSHDLRTPIARLRLRTSEVRPARVRHGVQHDLDDMDRFVTSVLDYLRGGDAEALQAVDLATIIQTIVDEAQDAGADVSYEGPRRLEASTRPVKLQRAVLNLVQNAVRHADRTVVSLRREGASAVIVVQDDGPGIPADKLEAVFQPFYRIEDSRNRVTGGAGLGLSIVRRAAVRLKGQVSLVNLSGGGLQATLVIPLEASS